MQLNLYDFKSQGAPAGQPDVILVHGTGGDASLWEKQVELLVPNGFRCLVPELRGHGGTLEPGDTTSLETHIEDLMQTLQVFKVRFPAIFVGHSLGAVISTMLAQQKPELFLQILAISMPGQVLPVVTGAFDLFLCTPYEKLRYTWLYKMLPRRLQILLLTNRDSMRQILANFRQAHITAAQLNVHCPVHFCAGGRDVVALAHQVRQFHKELPNSTFRLFGLSGHCCMDDEPEAFNDWFMDKILNGVQVLQPAGFYS